MNNQLTTDQLKELLEIQKEFDSRIPTLNLQDSKVAYVVEFFEWFNTLETFKNWKKKPGKPLEVQLDELADMLAFGLSIANQCLDGIENVNEEFSEKEIIDFIEKANRNLGYENAFTQFMYDLYNLYDYDYKTKMLLPLLLHMNTTQSTNSYRHIKRKWKGITQDKMEQQIKTKDMCKGGESHPDILDKVKEVLGR